MEDLQIIDLYWQRDEQAIREIYLLPFEMCVKNDPVTLNYV